jgi:hypothetical protein
MEQQARFPYQFFCGYVRLVLAGLATTGFG